MDVSPAQMHKILMLLKAVERLPVLTNDIVNRQGNAPISSIKGQIDVLHFNLVEIAAQAGEAKETTLQFTSLQSLDGVLPPDLDNLPV